MAKFTVKIQRAIPLPMANQLFSALFAKYPAFEDVRIVLSALFAPCFPFLPDRLLSFPQRGNFIKQFPADNRRMVVRHHPPAFPWIGCKTSHKITAFPLDRKLALDFDGNVPAVRIVEQVPHWDHDGIADLPRRLTVIVVRHCNQPNPHDRKNAFQITSHFNVISAKTG